MMLSADRIYKVFYDRHICLKREWLRNAIEYLQSVSGSDDIHPLAVFELWKYTDIAESTEPNPKLGDSLISAREFNGTMILQIQAVTDIGTSFLSQFKKLAYTGTDNAEFQSDAQSAESTKKDKEAGSRLLQLLLSDGVTQIKAIEYRRAEQLSLLTCPGCKVIVFGSVQIRRGVFLLRPECFQLLGGDVESLMQTNRPVQMMAAKLGLSVPAQKQQTTIPTATTRQQPLRKRSALDETATPVKRDLISANPPPTTTQATTFDAPSRSSIPSRPAGSDAPSHSVAFEIPSRPAATDASSRSNIPPRSAATDALPRSAAASNALPCSDIPSRPAAADPSSPAVARDAEALFGEYVASVLRAIPTDKRSDKRSKIFAILNSD